MTEPRPSNRPLPVIRGERVFLRPAERVFLRPAEREDLDRFVRCFSDAETTRHLALRSPFSRAMEDQWFERTVAGQGTELYHFVVCRLADGEPIGVADLRNLDLVNGNAEFGITIGEKSEWNQGYGTDTLNALCDFGFGELRLERIELQVYASNARARRSYEKAGFVLEGTLPRRHFSEGRHEDVLIMAQLREAWAALPRRRIWEMNELA